MDSDVRDRSALLTVLTTEHFTLQGARSGTITESLGRTTIYLGSLSASLVADALVLQGGSAVDDFRLFALVILPALVFLGTVTFVRVLETGIEDAIYAQAINRIRQYYLELAGDDARYFLSGETTTYKGVSRTWACPHPPGARSSASRASSLSSTAWSRAPSAALRSTSSPLAPLAHRRWGARCSCDDRPLPGRKGPLRSGDGKVHAAVSICARRSRRPWRVVEHADPSVFASRPRAGRAQAVGARQRTTPIGERSDERKCQSHCSLASALDGDHHEQPEEERSASR